MTLFSSSSLCMCALIFCTYALLGILISFEKRATSSNLDGSYINLWWLSISEKISSNKVNKTKYLQKS